MLKERDGNSRLFPDRPAGMPKGNQHSRQPVDYIPGTSNACEMLRRDLFHALKWADIKVRPELEDGSDLRASQPIRFHDLRARGITWRHARGDNPALIRQECAHEDERTKEIYIRRHREFRPETSSRSYRSGFSEPLRLTQIAPRGRNDDEETPIKQCRRRESLFAVRSPRSRTSLRVRAKRTEYSNDRRPTTAKGPRSGPKHSAGGGSRTPDLARMKRPL
jgi:hypothetical protein